MKSVRTPNPKSPLTSMTSGSSDAISLSARTNASRIGLHRIAAELAHGVVKLRALRASVMPQDLVLHERYAASLDRIGDDARRAIGTDCVREGAAQGLVIMPVGEFHVPTERAPFVGKRFEADGVRNRPE